MKAHDLARLLLESKNLDIRASIDISTNDKDKDRRIFTFDCHGVNNKNGDGDIITILFDANPEDNFGKPI
tara:strand:- start:548 stop:757 length:210 start_codon:yes stop_codon:yes gene_type:complete